MLFSNHYSISNMDDLQISGRSSAASRRPKHKNKSLGVNFSKTKKKSSEDANLVSQSKESRASTTYLLSPSTADKTGNPLLNSGDILEKLSMSLPPPENGGYENDIPVKDSVVMKPNFSSVHKIVREDHDSASAGVPIADSTEEQNIAAAKIQKQWISHKENVSTKEEIEEVPVFKMSDQLREMLDLERKKMLEEQKLEKTNENKLKADSENKKKGARLKAIEELNKKREEKRKLQQEMIEEELNMATDLKNSIRKKRGNKRVSPKNKLQEQVDNADKSPIKTKDSEKTDHLQKTEYLEKTENLEKTEDTTYDKLVDEIFLSNTRQVFPDSELNTPKVGWETVSPRKTENTQREEKKVFSSLLETLKMLEAESDEALSEAKSSSIIIPPTPKLTQGEAYKFDNFVVSDLNTAGVIQSGKIKNLLSFLDNADSHYCPSEIDSLTSATALEFKRLQKASAAVDEVTESIKDTQNQLSGKVEQIQLLKSELSTTSNQTSQLQAQVFATKLESDEKAKAVAMLRRALDEQRDLTVRLTSEQEKDTQQRLTNQKAEYETTIQRHLGFIDQLIADKKELSDKVESLVTQHRATEKRLSDKVRLLEDNQRVDIKKQKEAIEAAEKIKRERWIAEKSNQIKEMTVKGLEPEIQNLIAKSKAEIKRLNAVHEAELLAADERASKRFVAQVEELRSQLDAEKEAACARERDSGLKRFQKQVEQEEDAYQQQRRRLYAEVQEEKDRAAEVLNKQRSALDTERKTIEEEFNTKWAKFHAQHTLEIEGIQRDHENSMRDIKLRISVEKEQWLESQKQKQTADLMSREREIRAALLNERNKEIELVISKLEEQSALQKEENHATMECRMKRLKDKYESQIADLEHVQNTTQTKFNVMKERVTDLEADNIRSRGHIKTVERQYEDLEKVSNQLKSERDKVEEVIRGEFSVRLVKLEEENKNVKTELIECKTRYKLEIERIGKTHNEEMNEVQNRITSAFSKRDEVIKELKDKSSSAAARADHLEALLIKQREQLLKPVPR